MIVGMIVATAMTSATTPSMTLGLLRIAPNAPS
jgi:hypothetical protein